MKTYDVNVYIADPLITNDWLSGTGMLCLKGQWWPHPQKHLLQCWKNTCTPLTLNINISFVIIIYILFSYTRTSLHIILQHIIHCTYHKHCTTSTVMGFSRLWITDLDLDTAKPNTATVSQEFKLKVINHWQMAKADNLNWLVKISMQPTIDDSISSSFKTFWPDLKFFLYWNCLSIAENLLSLNQQ